MSRKDYRIIAEALRQAYSDFPRDEEFPNDETLAQEGIRHAAYTIALALSRDNPRFSRERFYDAIGI